MGTIIKTINKTTSFWLVILNVLFIILINFFVINSTYAHQTKYAQVDVSVLNVRNGPGTENKRIDTVVENEKLKILQEDQGWFKIKISDKKTGWIIEQYATKIKQKTEEKVLTTVEASSPLEVKANPKDDSDTVVEMTEHNKFEVLDIKNKWLKIKPTQSNLVGWVSKENVNETSYFVKTKEEKDKTNDKESNQDNKDIENIMDDVDFVSHELINDFDDQKARITASVLNIRKESGTNHPVISQVSRNSLVTILDSQDGWHKIETKDQEKGWVCNDYVQLINKNKNNLTNKVIVIDPGHGGSDPGAIGRIIGLKEKTVNINVSKHLYHMLIEKGAIPVLTRYDDDSLTLTDRIITTEKNNPDIFISVHANAYYNTEVSGTETYHTIGAGKKEKKLAEFVQKSLLDKLNLPDRGVKQENFLTIKNLSMPSILTEPAFLSHPEEEELLNDPDVQKKIARGVFEGIKQYFDQE